MVVIGGGAAGLMCAAVAGQRGRSVLLVEKSNKLGKKILMSGGGRCNFTNKSISSDNFICPNPHFVKSALAQYSQWDFIDLVERYQIAYHEKAQGQLFCDHSAKDILSMLVRECEQANVEVLLNSEAKISLQETCRIEIGDQVYATQSLVIACGGLSIPTLGGSAFAYKFAEQIDLSCSKLDAALVPFTFSGEVLELAKSLSGVSVNVEVKCADQSFCDAMLFTHRGLSGPAMLQISNYWDLQQTITIDLLPELDLFEYISEAKRNGPNTTLQNCLGQVLPKSVANALVEYFWPKIEGRSLQQLKGGEIQAISNQLKSWELLPSGTEGYRTAEVTRGGIDVAQISSKTMRAKFELANIYYIGEALDVTGQLGGYNFQWAWSSAVAAGRHV